MTGTVHSVQHDCKPSCTRRTAVRSKARGMSLHERLKRARVAAGYETATEAAEAFGWNVNTYRSNENGARPFSRESAIKYSRAFRVGVEWLITGRGGMKGSRRGVEVLGYVGAGAAVFAWDSGAFGEIEPPFGVPDDAFAFQVRGDSMWPAYLDGGYVIARIVENPADALYARVVVTLEDDRRFVKLLHPGSQPDTYTLLSLSPSSPPMADMRIKAVARVIGSVEP